MYLLTYERYITYQTGFSFRRLGHAQGWDFGVPWGMGGQIFFFPKFSQIWCRILRERGDLRWRAIECVLVLLEIPHKNGILLSQMGVQAYHMNPLCICNCRSYPCIINMEISLYKDDYIISFFFMGLLYGTHIGPIWATCIWANPTHMGPMRNPVVLPIWVAHMGPI